MTKCTRCENEAASEMLGLCNECVESGTPQIQTEDAGVAEHREDEKSKLITAGIFGFVVGMAMDGWVTGFGFAFVFVFIAALVLER